MNRRSQLIEALGLGPQWHLRQAIDPSPLAPPDTGTGLPPSLQPDDASATAAEATPVAAAATMPPTAPDTPPVDTPPAAPTPASAPPATAPAAPAPLRDWPELAAEVSQCQLCRLCETRTQTVLERGSRNARLMIVGEAPGEQEDRQGQPFVGPAGKLLDAMLVAAGWNPATDVYIANVLKCRPPGNRNPQADEIAACHDYLQDQLRLVQPAVVVALGRFAAQTLLQTEETIGRLRGKAHRYGDRPLIVSYHPAYLLRSLPDKAKAWQDWCLVRHTLRQA